MPMLQLPLLLAAASARVSRLRVSLLGIIRYGAKLWRILTYSWDSSYAAAVWEILQIEAMRQVMSSFIMGEWECTADGLDV